MQPTSTQPQPDIVLDETLETAPVPPLSEAEFLPRRAPIGRLQSSSANAAVARWCMVVVFAAALLCAALLAQWPQQLPAQSRTTLIAGFVLLALASAAALLVPRARLAHAITALLLLATAVMTVAAGMLGWGTGTPGLGMLGVFAGAACFVAGLGAGIAIAAVGALALLALHFGSAALPFAAAVPSAPSDTVQVVMHLLQIAAGLACGLAVTRVVDRQMRAAQERGQRFSGLLAIAADAYWEVDAQYRLMAITRPRGASGTPSMADSLGRPPWELARFGCDADKLDELQADLETRVPFRDLAAHWHSRDGSLHHFSISGEPRFDERGQFRGYWGVARDVTAHVLASQALVATETRYQELFSRIPTPLVLHRSNRIIDANPAALHLLGYDDLKGMTGRDILEHFESGDSRERARRRTEELDALAVGEALAIADFRLRGCSGRRILVRATGVRVDAQGGPATLSIFVNDTERRRAEEAVRRSEALLSHLVATSPDVITLTDLATGRYAMVNLTFERVTGYAAAEVVGKSSTELGIWRDPEQRERLINQVRERGAAREVACDFVTKSGQVVQLLLSGAMFAMDHRNYLVINGRDITAQERSRLERDAILENASIGIAVTREQHFVLTNPRFEQMYGWPEGALVGLNGSVVWPSSEDHDDIGARFGANLAAGELFEIERTAQRRDGSSFVARVLGKAIDPGSTAKGGTIWIVEDVTERRQVGEALARARDQAEAANRAKSAFLANTSHELRTPLNGMLGLAQLAREADIDDARRQSYLDQIVENAQALAAIISDVLDLSKIEAGKLELESTSFDLSELLAVLQQAYGTLAAGRGLTLRFDIEAGVCGHPHGHVQGDPLRVRQILSNYLANALKFADQGGVRLLARRLDGQMLRFEVHDSGPGIDLETQARLFKPFTQADESTTRRFGGTGLGLSICRELALLMGGEVGVISQPGQGACFWAELRLPAVPAPEPRRAVQALHDLHGMHVLMVEDNAVNMLIGVAMLERWGATVEQATDGRQAVHAVAQALLVGKRFDAVLMDVQMPVMSGYEATRELRRLETDTHLPIIALTAAALVSERARALEAGMDDFLTKPIDAEKLREALGRLATVH